MHLYKAKAGIDLFSQLKKSESGQYSKQRKKSVVRKRKHSSRLSCRWIVGCPLDTHIVTDIDTRHIPFRCLLLTFRLLRT